jgi:hypothetical protein
MWASTRPPNKLFKVADTPEKMLALGEEGVREHIKTIGLFRNKAKNVIALSKMIMEEFGGEVPQTRDELVRLPGVGRKTANVVLNEAFGQPPSRWTPISSASATAPAGAGQDARRGRGAPGAHHPGRNI